MTDRVIDWRAFVNRLQFCYGCGKFGLPRKGKLVPNGWNVIYQPHPDGRPGLHVCSEDCKEAVQRAMIQGPVTEPLMMPEPGAMMMPAEVRQAMEDEIREGLVKEAFDPESWAGAKEMESEYARSSEPVSLVPTEGETDEGDTAESSARDSDPTSQGPRSDGP